MSSLPEVITGRVALVTKLKNQNFDNSKTQIVTKLKKKLKQDSKTKIVTKLKLTLWQNSKIKLWHILVKTTNLTTWHRCDVFWAAFYNLAMFFFLNITKGFLLSCKVLQKKTLHCYRTYMGFYMASRAWSIRKILPSWSSNTVELNLNIKIISYW